MHGWLCKTGFGQPTGLNEGGSQIATISLFATKSRIEGLSPLQVLKHH
jgi:hypothetical protein